MHLTPSAPSIFANSARLGSAVISAAAITLLLFAAMQQLIKAQSIERPAVVEHPIVELFQPPEETDIAIKKTIPEPPPPVDRDIPRIITPTDDITDITPGDFALGELAPKMTAAKQDWQNRPSDKSAAPIVRIEPRYPQQAARDGITGWVRLGFTIDESGAVTDIQVLAAEPANTFNREAVRALARWKYQPQWINGKTVRQTGMQVQLDFNLQQD